MQSTKKFLYEDPTDTGTTTTHKAVANGFRLLEIVARAKRKTSMDSSETLMLCLASKNHQPQVLLTKELDEEINEAIASHANKVLDALEQSILDELAEHGVVIQEDLREVLNPSSADG